MGGHEKGDADAPCGAGLALCAVLVDGNTDQGHPSRPGCPLVGCGAGSGCRHNQQKRTEKAAPSMQVDYTTKVRSRTGMKKAPELGGEGLQSIRGEYSTCGPETPVRPPRVATGRSKLTERTGRSSRSWVQCITVQVARASTFSSQAPSPSSGCRRPSRDSRPPRCGRRRGSTARRLGAATSARRRGWS